MAVVVRVPVSGQLLAWARDRSGVAAEDLRRRFAKLDDWEAGTASPTLKQLEQYADATHTPVGYFFLPGPPDIEIPLPDFRRRAGQPAAQPSPDLLDTIYQSQQRQEWYRDYARSALAQPLQFVGSLEVGSDVAGAAETIRRALRFEIPDRPARWDDAFRQLADNAEDLGVLVMVNGVVGSNTHRKLDPAEFQGFALADAYAPVIFVNGADTRAAQIFTLFHEMAHIWTGQDALDDSRPGDPSAAAAERWCSRVAAECLAPLEDVASSFNRAAPLAGELDRLASKYRASTLVVLGQLRDAGRVPEGAFGNLYRAELDRLRGLVQARAGDGGNFYNTQPVRTSKAFTRAVITSTLEGQTLYKDALRMLGFRKISTFNALASKLGVT